MASQKLQGIFCPNMVPFDDRGALNEDELRRLIDYLIERGLTGLYPNGSTGEFVRLDYAERRRVIEIACERAQRASGGAVTCRSWRGRTRRTWT